MKPLVLIYTNDRNFGLSVKSLVRRGNYFAMSAFNMEEAKTRINCFPPHVVLVDVDTGSEIIDEIHKTERLKNIPILVAGSSNAVSAVSVKLKRGIGDGVIKPINSKVLWTKIDKLYNEERMNKPNYIKFPANEFQAATIKVEGRLVELCESGFSFECGVDINETFITKLKSRFFISLGFDPYFSIVYPRRDNKRGFYEGSFVGIKEDDAVSIRSWINKKLTRGDKGIRDDE